MRAVYPTLNHPPKHRKGKVGARLPFEPWELGSSTMVPGPPSSMGQDFTSELDTDFLDFTDDDDDLDDPTADQWLVHLFHGKKIQGILIGTKRDSIPTMRRQLRARTYVHTPNRRRVLYTDYY